MDLSTIDDAACREVLDRYEAQVQWVEATFAADAARVLADHLRSTGEYAALLARARDKERVLAAEERSGGGRLDVSDEELYRWYFEERLGRPVPASLEGHARSAGFEDLDSLRRAASRELTYARALARRAAA